MNLPSTFRETILSIFGDRGREWLDRLPDIAVRCRTQWDLRDSVIGSHLSINYIEFAAVSTGELVALKIGVPHSELWSEFETLQLYSGKGMVRLLDWDRDAGAMLLQRLQPGTMLRDISDNREQTRIAGTVMRALSAPPPNTHTLPRYSDWVKRAFQRTRSEWDPLELMPRDLLDKAEAALQYIQRESSGDVVLHGDLHHENMLWDSQCGWVAIDPKGVIGPPFLETGRFLHNQIPDELSLQERERILQERLDVFHAELGYSPNIIAAGGLVDCILSHCWYFEDGPGENIEADLQPGIEMARILYRLSQS